MGLKVTGTLKDGLHLESCRESDIWKVHPENCLFTVLAYGMHEEWPFYITLRALWGT